MVLLIIGAEGFVGKHLLERMKSDATMTIHTTYLKSNYLLAQEIISHKLDITKLVEVQDLIKQIKPNFIVHLAAQSSVSVSWSQPNLTVNVNINGVINLLESIRLFAPRARVLLVGSSEEYGKVLEQDNPIQETYVTQPFNIYALTKDAQNKIGKIYSNAYNLDIIMTRSFNHFGPGQLPTFVVADFCKQLVEIEKGFKKNELVVGNLDAKRDFADVRDVVEAYYQLLMRGQKGETYNVGSGKSIKVSELLNLIVELSSVSPKIIIDQQKYRPIDVPIVVADISKVTKHTGWVPKISLIASLQDTLAYWRLQL
jgi:GDP-4-dehydro-6-deoxy-D-mannose reductase